ncbi:hypothetical protein VNO78_06368 [Psophocarpus tetragonolobus]|uniref:Uncharacterized protein n=1 Tax=Psophocarpus tetragonolobus TaxID=3891 RepID=A0AAN9SS22_PSOTE
MHSGFSRETTEKCRESNLFRQDKDDPSADILVVKADEDHQVVEVWGKVRWRCVDDNDLCGKQGTLVSSLIRVFFQGIPLPK